MAIARREEQTAWSSLTRKQKRGFTAIKQDAVIRDGIVYDINGNDVSHRAELVVKTTEKQHEGLRAIDEISEHEIQNGGFVFALYESCKTMEDRFPTLSQSDLARLMFIGTFTGYNTGRLQHDNGRIIDRKKLESLVKLSRAKFSAFYKKLIAENIIQETGGELFMNPSVFYRGALKDADYALASYQHTRLFRQTIRDLYERYGGRSIKQLAIIYAVLPFVNFDTNIVCLNPTEDDKDKLQPMNLDNLAALLHYQDTQKLKRALESIKLDSQPVFYLPHNVHDRRERRVIINPRVVYAGSAKSLAAIKVLFN